MIWYVGMYGSFAVGAVLVYYKPDTRCAPSSRPRSRRNIHVCRPQYPNMGVEGGKGQDGGARREDRLPVTAVSRVVDQQLSISSLSPLTPWPLERRRS